MITEQQSYIIILTLHLSDSNHVKLVFMNETY